MIILRQIVLLSFGFLLVCGLEGPAPPQPNNVTTIKPPDTTTTKTTTTTPTPKPTPPSTPKPTPPPTPKPTPPPTPKPTPPTPEPTPPPTSKPTPKPGPTPEPTPGTWSVVYKGTNRTCIVAQLAIQIEVPVENSTMKINLPTTAVASGDCSQNNTEFIAMNWENGNMMRLNFNKTNTSKFELTDMSFALNLTFPGKNASIYNYEHKKCEFSAPLTNSYKCFKVQTFNLTGVTDTKSMAHLHISHVQLQAFHNATGPHFDSAIDCAGSTADVVPIVVGCVLAGLVIMVLVGYLIGRRHCQARGYLSMFSETKTEADYIPMKNLSCFN